MFAYCNNNPINRVEIAGYFSVKCWDDASDYSLGFDDIMGIAGGGAILAFGAKIVTDILTRPKSITLPESKRIAYETARSIAVAKIASTITKESKDRYWTATIRGDYVDIGRPISLKEAIDEVARGNSVFTVTRSEAANIAYEAGKRMGVGPEINKGKENMPGYYYHYHIYNRANQGHVFFLFWY